MEILAFTYFLVAAIYIVFMVVTIKVFDRKGHSPWLGFFLSLILPIIALVVALIMPYDQPALAERKKRADLDRDFHARINKQPEPEEPQAFTTIQTVSGLMLIFCPLIAAFQPGEMITGIMGILSILALIALSTVLLARPQT